MELRSEELGRRRAGVCLHVSSLSGRRGIGEIGAGAIGFMDWMQASGLSVWQFLPIGPTGYGNSPYQLLSVFAGNPLFIDLDGLVEMGLLSPQELLEYPELPEDEVDFARVLLAKSDYLHRAARRFQEAGDSELRAEHARFVADNDDLWLRDYALFVALKRGHDQMPWTDWAPAYRDRNAEALSDLAQSAGSEIERIKFVQYLFFKQWRKLKAEARSRGILLFGDLPIYMALDCAESWARPDLLYLDEDGRPPAVAGVPPDYFSEDGQLWGNPIYRWPAHEAESFAWWVSRLRHALASVDLIRLDHFRGFEAYWSVPADAATARAGSWEPGPRERLFQALEQALGSVPIVAEDLGVITEEVTALRKAFKLPGMQVLQFLVDRRDFDLGRIQEDCACYTGTHDNDTTLGWFNGSSGMIDGDALIQLQQQVLANTGGDAEHIHLALISLCFKSRARMAIAPMQDYLGLGSSARLNTPGEAFGNWRWRVTADQLVRADTRQWADWTAESGRR